MSLLSNSVTRKAWMMKWIDSYISSNIVPVRTPNKGNENIDNNSKLYQTKMIVSAMLTLIYRISIRQLV